MFAIATTAYDSLKTSAQQQAHERANEDEKEEMAQEADCTIIHACKQGGQAYRTSRVPLSDHES